MKRLLIFSCMTLLLVGCAATGPIFEPAKAPNVGEALVYIYRPQTKALSARSAKIQVDGVTVIDLSNNGYTAIYVKPGHHKISQNYPALLGVFGGGKTEIPLEISINSRAGERQYIEVAPRSTTTQQGSTTTIQFVWTLAERSESKALTLLGGCKFEVPIRQQLSSISLNKLSNAKELQSPL